MSVNSGVASIVSQTYRSSIKDRNPVEALLMYVVVVWNIIKVAYACIKVVVMKCQWIKPNLIGAS